MTRTEVDFDKWFLKLHLSLRGRIGMAFDVEETMARKAYEAGRNVFDVIEEMAVEHKDKASKPFLFVDPKADPELPRKILGRQRPSS